MPTAAPTSVPFVKMHGLGNDFVVLDARTRSLPKITAGVARALADRHTGIGCDQLIVLEPSVSADFRMRIFNADGGEAEACGNAARAVARFHGHAATIETHGRIIGVTPGAWGRDGGDNGGATVDMGEPKFDWQAIPLAYAMDTSNMPVGWSDGEIELTGPAAVNVGNPHIVFFADDCEAVPLDRLGPEIEADALFPERINVNVATIESRTAIRLRVWERGAGLTRACGTGACATAVAAIRRGLVDRSVAVTLPGGVLDIEWTGSNHMMMTGPAATSFIGSFDWADYA